METRRPRGKLREEILDVANRLLMETGDAHEVSIDTVVDAVGCTPPSLYYYFPSKEQLLFEVCRRQYRRFADELEATVPETNDPLVELAARRHAYLDWAIAHPEHYRLLFMATTGQAPEGQEVDPRETPGLRELINNIDRARSSGQIVAPDSLQVAFALWSTVHGVASLAVVSRTLTPEMSHAAVDFAGHAILTALAARAQ